MKRVIFVGMHNKPNMKALDSKTRTGKCIDEIIKRLEGYECIKSNLCDLNYAPTDSVTIDTQNLEWQKKFEPQKNDIVVLLGQWVYDNYRFRLWSHVIKATHPAGVFGPKNRSGYVDSIVDKVNYITD